MFIPELPTAFARRKEALELKSVNVLSLETKGDILYHLGCGIRETEALELQASAQDSLQVISYPDERWSDMSRSRGPGHAVSGYLKPRQSLVVRTVRDWTWLVLA